jgi:hypothetical protein
MATVDISDVIALTNKATDAETHHRLARCAELFGRAVAAAQALQQPDCAIVACLQMLQGRPLSTYAGLPGVPPAEATNAYRTTYCELLPAALAVVQRRSAAGTLLPGACRAHEEAWYRAYLEHCIGRADVAACPNIVQLVGHELHVHTAWLLLSRMLRAPLLPLLAAYTQAGAMLADCAFLTRTFDLVTERRLPGVLLTCEEMLAIIFKQAVTPPVARLLCPDLRARQEMMRAFCRLEACARMQQPHVRARLDISLGHTFEALVAVARSPAMRACALDGCMAHETHVSQFKLCAACQTVVYCSKAHQAEDWAAHKAACKAARMSAAAAAVAVQEGGASGA